MTCCMDGAKLGIWVAYYFGLTATLLQLADTFGMADDERGLGYFLGSVAC